PALVPADVEAAVLADGEVLRIPRIDPERVLIDVARIAVPARSFEGHEGLPAIERFRPRQAGEIDELFGRRLDAKLAEVHRPRVAVADDRPRRAFVRGSEYTADRRVGRRHDSGTGVGQRTVVA